MTAEVHEHEHALLTETDDSETIPKKKRPRPVRIRQFPIDTEDQPGILNCLIASHLPRARIR